MHRNTQQGISGLSRISKDLPVSSMSTSHVQCCHTANKDLCSSLLARCPVTHFPLCPWNPGSTCVPLMSSAKRSFTDLSPEASSCIRGARVLARNEADGYYYLGHIVQEVKGSRERFLIEFDKSHAPKGKVQQLRLQETPLYDILHYEDARRRPLASGDRVLAPWETRAERFGPGSVLKIVENKGAHLAGEPTWPTGCRAQQEDAYLPGTGLMKEELSKKTEEQLSEMRILPSESVSREEQKKEEKKLKTENVPKDIQSCLAEDNELVEPKQSPKREMSDALVDAAVNTDRWLMESFHKEEAESRQQDAKSEGLFESRVAEAPIQHSQRSPSLRISALVPFRRQSFFDCVNQSLQKDSLTIKSALRVQRLHSTPILQASRSTNLLKGKSITKSVLNGGSQKSWQEMDFSKAKIDHKRKQEEQRQLKREQQQEADGIQRQLHRDNQRQRLHQRRLQELEKQLEHRDRALQHMALLQAAGAERSRKESFLIEEEKRKASQRLQFLKTRRLQREELQAERSERSFEQEKERLDFLRSRMQSRQEVLEEGSHKQDRQQKQHQAAKGKAFQSRDRSHQKMEKEGKKLCELQQYLREQNLLTLRASLLA
ncbi:trichohyalin-like isoform X6 [Pogoniulus pusillus]|uniref:trichohyalin-like isoform X6 n=1 Tax=Pogoniulus pusillus TaxID=488313 RepID=UPI0030B93CEF